MKSPQKSVPRQVKSKTEKNEGRRKKPLRDLPWIALVKEDNWSDAFPYCCLCDKFANFDFHQDEGYGFELSKVHEKRVHFFHQDEDWRLQIMQQVAEKSTPTKPQKKRTASPIVKKEPICKENKERKNRPEKNVKKRKTCEECNTSTQYEPQPSTPNFGTLLDSSTPSFGIALAPNPLKAPRTPGGKNDKRQRTEGMCPSSDPCDDGAVDNLEVYCSPVCCCLSSSHF